MKKSGKGHFIAGFLLGAVMFGGSIAFAAGITASPTTSKILVDGKEVKVEAYNINGRNYLQLRDMAAVVDFGVIWDGDNNQVLIYPGLRYDPDAHLAAQTPQAAHSPTVAPSPTPTVSTASKVKIYTDENKPVLGETPGKILIDPDAPIGLGYEYYYEPYWYGLIGECAWYAPARFTEVNGISLNIRPLGYIKDWLDTAAKYDDLEIIRNVAEIRNYSIAIFPQNTQSTGHVVFIEYVERDSNGKPLNIYFTEANGANTLNKGQFDPGYDGIVQMLSFEDFINKPGGLAGYIAPKK